MCLENNGCLKDLAINYDLVNTKRINVLKETPLKACSLQSLIHITQLINSGTVKKYDYGEKENQKRYGSSEAPEVDFSKIKNTVSIHVPVDDKFADDKDNQEVSKLFPSLAKYELIGAEMAPFKGVQMDHAAVITGHDTRWFSSVINLLDEYNK